MLFLKLSTAVANAGSYELLEPATKAAILAQMCNELLYCRNVVREIEGSIEVVAKLKGDKWAAEGQLRQYVLVILLQKRFYMLQKWLA